MSGNKIVSFDDSFEEVMSSLEVASLTDKNHHDVCRDIRTQLYEELYGVVFNKADLLYPSIQGLTRVEDPHTKRTKEFLMDQDHSVTLVSGYDVKARFAIAKRWRLLEEEKANSNLSYEQNQEVSLPKTYIEALEALVVSEKEKLALEQKIESDAPKVDFYEDVAASDETMLIGSVAKILEIAPMRLFQDLRLRGFLTKDNEPTARAINQGYMRSKIYKRTYNGNEYISVTALVTTKGLIFLRKKYLELSQELKLYEQ